MNATLPDVPKPSFAELFTPKLVTVFREGYEWHLRADALAGLTVAIVALPLSMAITGPSGRHDDRFALRRHPEQLAAACVAGRESRQGRRRPAFSGLEY